MLIPTIIPPFNFEIYARPKEELNDPLWEKLKEITPFNHLTYFEDLKTLFDELSSCSTVEEEYNFIKKSCSLNSGKAIFARDCLPPQPFSRYKKLSNYADTSINTNTYVSGTEIHLPGLEKIYVGQAPLPNYFKNFFAFLQNQGVSDIIAIGPEMENSSPKLDSYFHFENEQQEEQVDPREAILNRSSFAHHVQKKELSYAELGYKKIAESCPYEKILHFNCSWIDLKSITSATPLRIYRLAKWLDNFPTSPELLLESIKVIYEARKEKTAPLFVHCSGGIGRSGVFILAYYFYSKLIQKKKAELNIPQALLILRILRPGMVKTLKEYELVHKTVELMFQ